VNKDIQLHGYTIPS